MAIWRLVGNNTQPMVEGKRFGRNVATIVLGAKIRLLREV